MEKDFTCPKEICRAVRHSMRQAPTLRAIYWLNNNYLRVVRTRSHAACIRRLPGEQSIDGRRKKSVRNETQHAPVASLESHLSAGMGTAYWAVRYSMRQALYLRAIYWWGLELDTDLCGTASGVVPEGRRLLRAPQMNGYGRGELLPMYATWLIAWLYYVMYNL